MTPFAAMTFLALVSIRSECIWFRLVFGRPPEGEHEGHVALATGDGYRPCVEVGTRTAAEAAISDQTTNQRQICWLTHDWHSPRQYDSMKYMFQQTR
jgi:hypothetical protein